MDDTERMCRESALSKALVLVDYSDGRRNSKKVLKDAKAFLDFLMPEDKQSDEADGR